MDLELIGAVARQRPQWQFVFIGPVVKIDAASLPNLSNVHYLGPRQYDDLPDYLSGWDVAIMPFALNESTRYISPTKTPEYLAGGRAVVSTPITDVIRSYGDNPAVHIADSPETFVAAMEAALAMPRDERPWSFGLLAAIVTLAGSCAVGVQWSMKLIVDAMAASGSRGDGAVAPVALSWSDRA